MPLRLFIPLSNMSHDFKKNLLATCSLYGLIVVLIVLDVFFIHWERSYEREIGTTIPITTREHGRVSRLQKWNAETLWWSCVSCFMSYTQLQWVRKKDRKERGVMGRNLVSGKFMTKRRWLRISFRQRDSKDWHITDSLAS